MRPSQPFVRLKQCNQFAENPRDIPAVNFVNDQYDRSSLCDAVKAIILFHRIDERLCIRSPVVLNPVAYGLLFNFFNVEGGWGTLLVKRRSGKNAPRANGRIALIPPDIGGEGKTGKERREGKD